MDSKDQQQSAKAFAQRRSRELGLTLAVFLTGFTSQIALADQPTCSTRITNQWGSGSQVEVTIHNDNSAPLTDWHIELSYNNGRVNHSWSSIQEGDNPVLFSAPSWSPTISTGGSYTFGYIAEHASGLETASIDACYAGERVTDEDQDGIEDSADLCPSTPTGEIANAEGCSASQLDDDDDSVNNAIDQCPTTPVGATVNTEGCAASQLDDDNDGITNDLDQCAATPAGESADANGCSASQRDTDQDGISDAADQCPATPTGETANAEGCSASQLDDDGDSVNNALDLCPATPAGEAVNSEGCAASQLDDDNDGITNDIDQCVATPTGESADATGCSASQRDTDQDGINDAADQCPATPTGETANAEGCSASQLDDDGDSVNNAIDQCPATPVGATVNSEGCAASELDDDNDGITNDLDQCAATPAGESADSTGCAASQRDTDKDGINDAIDQCPATPAGEAVNTQGCAASQLDDDNDGITNDLDQCAATPTGESADATGCSASQRDTDQDGINDASDQCPATPASETANAEGCSASQLDDDGDSVNNAIDQCPATPEGEAVNTEGCAASQLDDDNDGITNDLDQCAATPTSESADATGCSASQRDTDQDGISDDADQCPATPTGETANAEGCSASQLDDDGDSVNNALDQCPATPAGEAVNTEGCAASELDDDSDGVSNDRDICPATPTGASIDINGCAMSQLDTDEDGVSNANDLCPNSNSAISVTHYGCAFDDDEDGDFIPNEFDFCPFAMGFTELRGCKPSFGDFDSDGIEDERDNCPFSISRDMVVPDEFTSHPANFFIPDSLGCSAFDKSSEQTSDHTIRGQDQCPNTFPSFISEENNNINGCTQEQLRDEDNDGVINGLDICPNEFGIKHVNGCNDGFSASDADFDGVPNEVDACPFSPNAAFEEIGPNGCLTKSFGDEDTDLDGIRNQFDQCPQTPQGHVVDVQGCTPLQERLQADQDGDFVPDAFDQCLGTTPSFNDNPINQFGCFIRDRFFDQDGDGIANEQDSCPNEPGFKLSGGCPTSFNVIEGNSNPQSLGGDIADRDNDGVPDFDDRCPYTSITGAGPLFFDEDFIGCMINDFNDDDLDGVINGKDRCHNTLNQQFLDSEGCNDWQRLDSDGDRLINGEDLCPTVFGRWQHNGCADDPLDSDRDGVPNERDQCPATPGGTFGPFAPVDLETGCANSEFEDSDFDNVPNLEDRCPNTPFGAQVFNDWHEAFDLIGCDIDQSKKITNPDQEADEDNDGVPDIFDQCLGTPPGASIDGTGCSNPFADDDRDGIQDIEDQCLGSRFARPMDFNGCELTITPVVNNSVRLRQLPPFSPENPNGPQEHEINLTSLITWPEELIGQAEFIDVHLQINEVNEQFVDIFQFSPDEVAIHVRPEFREMSLHIPAQIFIPQLGIHTNWFEIVISPNGAGGNAELGSLIVNDAQLLFDTDIRLSEVFFRLTNEPLFEAGTELFRQFWDSQRSPPVSDTPFFCTGEMNGFPIVCNRPETQVAFMDEFNTQREMDFYTLTAVVNRMDLRRGNWDDCGEHRLVFAAQGHPQGRKFFIFEARIPNPTPGDIRGCEAPIRFWQDMAQLQGFEKTDRIRRFFIDGDGMPPVISAPHFFHEAGQIRTNQFLGGEWLLKEHKLVDTCAGPRCGIFAETVTVKENPFGELFNPELPFSPSPFSQQAAAFQDAFLDAIGDLAGEFFGSLKTTTPDDFNHGQSHASGIEAEENDFRMHFFRGSQGTPFENDINFNLQGRFNADGSPLQVDQLLARATGLTCGGCHEPDRFGLTAPGAIGAMRLPDGRIIDSWPRSNGFVHIDEFSRLSPALEEVFLPIRQAGFAEVIEEFNQSLSF